MDRSRLVALLLLGTALAGCSTASSETPKQAASNQVAPTVPGRSLAVDLDAQIRQAQALRSSGDFAGATKMLSQLMLVAPDDPRVVGEYGKVLVQEGRSRDALDFLKRGVQLAPGDWTLYSATGVAYDQNGDYTNAKIAYQQALAIKPGNAGVLNNFALSRMQAGDLAGARQLMAQASSGGAGDPKITSNVALLASLTPTPAATAAPMPSQPRQLVTSAATKPDATAQAHTAPARTDVIMQQVPIDPQAGKIKPAPHKFAANPPHKVAAAAPSKAKTTAADTHKVAASAPAKTDKTNKAKTPALRMTADAATP
jgi:Flp pilus assembly protein TadD